MKVYISYALAHEFEPSFVPAVSRALAARGHQVRTSSAAAGLGDTWGPSVAVVGPAAVAAEDVAEAVVNAITEADVVVALLEVDSAGVGFQVALATMLKTPVLLVTRVGNPVSPLLQHLQLVVLGDEEQQDIMHVLERVEALGRVLRDAVIPPRGDDLTALEPAAVEERIVEWLREDFTVIVASTSGEHGYDFVIEAPKGAWLVEVKKRGPQGRVSAETVARLAAAVSAGGARGGIVVGPDYTSAAAALAARSRVGLLTFRDFVQGASARVLLADLLGEAPANANDAIEEL